jgi:DNA-binding protein YbaB
MESFKTSQRIGERSGSVLQELSYTFVEGTAADGKVGVTFNGQQIPVGVTIDETYLQGIKDVDELCLALTKAMQDAHYKSGIRVEEKMKSLYDV